MVKNGLRVLGCSFIFLLGLFVYCVEALDTKKEPEVQDIVNNTNRVAYYQGKDGRARVSMHIVDSKGRTRNREFTMLRFDELPPKKEVKNEDSFCGSQKFYMYFHRPADVNKMAYMVWKHVDKDDDRWVYLPALDLVRRIAATEKRSSFVGSDFFYEDVSGRNIKDDYHELVDTTKYYYVLKNTPKNLQSVEFAYFKMWVHKGTFIPVKTEYYDKEGQKYRIYEALKVETVQGYPTVVKAKMQDLKTNGNTTVEYSRIKYNMKLPEDIFTERYLRRPPVKYLR